MSRKAIFDAVRVARGGQAWATTEIHMLDAVLDQLGVPRENPAVLAPSRGCLEIIRAFESCKLEAYPDPGSGGDPWTIGWGATGPGIRKGVTWTQAQADTRLREDVERFAGEVRKLVEGTATSQPEFDALVSFAYNVGAGPKGLGGSTLLRKHRAGDKAGAAAEFARWNRANGKVLNGLTRRRAAEAAMYRS